MIRLCFLLCLVAPVAVYAEPSTQGDSVLIRWLPMLLSGACTGIVSLALYGLNSKIQITVNKAVEDRNTAHVIEKEKMFALMEAQRRDMEKLMSKMNALAALSLKGDNEALVKYFTNSSPPGA